MAEPLLPSPSPERVASPLRRPTLPAEINTATRAPHTHLNRLITARLPLCLPPHSQTPNLYSLGLHHFAHIYLTFESLWSDLCASVQSPVNNAGLSTLLDDPWVSVTQSSSQSQPTQGTASQGSSSPPSSPLPGYGIAPAPVRPAGSHDPKLLQFLAQLRPAGLARSKRLKQDLMRLDALSAIDLSVRLSSFPSPAVQSYATHIRRSVFAKPHVLVAYAWVMYMAIFSGGRWIREQLLSAGPEFWRSGEKGGKDRPLEQAGLSFWSFDGEKDGEDIKASFKQRLAGAEELLTPAQRRDIVEEARDIFGRSVALVDELDGLLDTPAQIIAAGGEAMRRGRSSGSRQGKEKESEKEAVREQASSVSATLRPSGLERQHLQHAGVAGLALVLSCVSWYAMYHAGTWS